MQNARQGNSDIFKLAWPIAMNAILLQLILIIDTLLVTPLGEESLAAMGLSASIGGLCLGLLFAFSNGTQLYIAQAFGAKKQEKILTGFKAGLAINIILAVVAVFLIFVVGLPLIRLIANTDTMMELSIDYISLFSIVVLAYAGCQHLTVYFNAIGKSRLPLYANIIELPINVVFSLVLIYGWGIFPEMGLKGAAVGTSIAVSFRLIILICFKVKQESDYNLSNAPKLSYIDVKKHLQFATPIAGTFVSMVLAGSVCMMIYANLDVYQFAALTLITPWSKVMAQIPLAWSTATSIIVGQILGSKEWEWLDHFVSRAWRLALVLSLGLSLSYLGMFFLFEIIYPELEQRTLDTLWLLMPVLVIVPFIRVSNTLCGHVLRAGGDAVHVFKIHSYTQWLIIVPLSALFVLYLELSVVWVFVLSLVEEVIKGVPFHKRMYSGKWKNNLLEH